jgi:hypothetical protein
MNQRRIDNVEFIPKQIASKTKAVNEKPPEDLIFDEAIKSEKLETKKDYLKEIDKKQTALKEKLKDLKDDKDIEKTKSRIKRNDEMQDQIKKNIEEQIKKNKDKAN